MCTPANAVSFLENRHFLLHRPPLSGGSEILCVDRMRYLKNFVSLQTLFPLLRIAIFCRIAPLCMTKENVCEINAMREKLLISYLNNALYREQKVFIFLVDFQIGTRWP